MNICDQHVHPSVAVPLKDVEKELTRQLVALDELDQRPMQRVRMSNLIVYCRTAAQSQSVQTLIPEISRLHPARVVLVEGDTAGPDTPIEARVMVSCRDAGQHQQGCAEVVLLRAGGADVAHLPFAVRRLLIGDLPTNLWWASSEPPATAGLLLADLAEQAQQIVYDSLGWLAPAQGVLMTAHWLERIEQTSAGGVPRVASDLNWRRLKYWRRIVMQALDPQSAPGAVDSVSEIEIEHGPHAVVQGWELASWLSGRLGWTVLSGASQPNVALTWQTVTRLDQAATIRIRRLESGPPGIVRVKLRCLIDNAPAVLDLRAESEHRLALRVEGRDCHHLTLTVPALTDAEHVGRQLSDREQDPVFRDAMRVAEVLAEGLGDL